MRTSFFLFGFLVLFFSSTLCLFSVQGTIQHAFFSFLFSCSLQLFPISQALAFSQWVSCTFHVAGGREA